MRYRYIQSFECHTTDQSPICKSYLRRFLFWAYISSIILFCNINIHAQDDGFQSMEITFADNTNTILPILDTTQIIIEDDSIVFQISGDMAWNYKISEIKGLSYSTFSVNAIEEIDDCSPKYILKGELLTIVAPAKIALWHIDGTVAKPLTFIENDEVIDLSPYVQGIYVLFINGKTFKILKK